VVERFSPSQSCIDVDAEGLLHAVLADEFGQTLRAEGELDYALLRDYFRGGYLGARHLGFDDV
jgi:hypothetical protein